MEILNKIYESEYFVVILFSVIAVLTFLFVLVAILGRKDKKKEKNIEKEDAINSNVAFGEVINEPASLEIPVNEEMENFEKELDEPIKEDITPVIETAIITEETDNGSLFEPNELENPDTKAIDFSELPPLDIVSEEPVIESLEKENSDDNQFDEINNDDETEEFSFATPIIETETKELNIIEDEEDKEERKSFKDAPFSPVELTPVEFEEPALELPKEIELPKKVDEDEEEEITEFQPLEKDTEESFSASANVFSNIEPEVYSINDKDEQ